MANPSKSSGNQSQSGKHGSGDPIKPAGGSFGSLAAALRAAGLADDAKPTDAEEAAPAENRGWSYNTGDGIQLSEEALAKIETGSDRALARPPAFYPMADGPPQYRDPGSDELRILYSFGIRTVFPPDVMHEVAQLPHDPDPADYVGREDLRADTIFTIDGEDAKDFDDAISMRLLPNGNLLLGVHIADVSHYVREGTALDDEAHARGTSVYLPDQVVPMLPEQLSNNLCSLVPDRDRLTRSAIIEYTPDGTLVDRRIVKSVIHSRHRCSYRVVQDLLDGKSTDETAKIESLTEPLKQLEKWTRKQQQLRDERDSMRLQSIEQKIRFNEQHVATEIIDAPRYFSQTLIEETALAANRVVGKFFHDERLPMLFRVHAEKNAEETVAIIKMLGEHGIRVPTKDRLTGRDVAALILQARSRPNARALTQRIMGLVERAEYELIEADQEAEHWGLASKSYLHFTSPIRRYSDLVVHRSHELWLSDPEAARETLRSEKMLKELKDTAAHCTLRHEIADITERAITDLKICELAESHLGEKHQALIDQVSRAGLQIFLPELNLLGFIPMNTISTGYATIKGPKLEIEHRGKRLFFKEGGQVSIKIAATDVVRLKVLFELTK